MPSRGSRGSRFPLWHQAALCEALVSPILTILALRGRTNVIARWLEGLHAAVLRIAICTMDKALSPGSRRQHRASTTLRDDGTW